MSATMQDAISLARGMHEQSEAFLKAAGVFQEAESSANLILENIVEVTRDAVAKEVHENFEDSREFSKECIQCAIDFEIRHRGYDFDKEGNKSYYEAIEDYVTEYFVVKQNG